MGRGQRRTHSRQARRQGPMTMIRDRRRIFAVRTRADVHCKSDAERIPGQAHLETEPGLSLLKERVKCLGFEPE